MKKLMIPAVVLAAVMLASLFAGCININIPVPTEAPSPITDAPETQPPVDNTEPPAVTDAPADPTEPPVTVPFVGGGIVINPGESVSIDLNCDGIDDDVTLFATESDPEYEYFLDYHLAVTLGGTGKKFQLDAETYSFDAFAVIIDCDPNDDRLEVLVNTQYEDNYGNVYAVRVNKNSNGLDWWLQYGNLSLEDYGGHYFENNMFFIHDYTDLIGTHGIYAEFSVGEDGFYMCSDYWTYEPDWWTDPEYAPKVIVEMPGYRVNSDGTPGQGIKVKKGTILHPVYSDLETFVVVRLSDGTLVWLDVSYPGERWDPYIFGHEQDYYMELPYAG